MDSVIFERLPHSSHCWVLQGPLQPLSYTSPLLSLWKLQAGPSNSSWQRGETSRMRTLKASVTDHWHQLQLVRNAQAALAVWPSCLERHPITNTLWVQFPARAHPQDVGLIPGPAACDPQSRHIWCLVWACTGGNQLMLLSLPLMLLSLPSSLFKKQVKNVLRQG